MRLPRNHEKPCACHSGKPYRACCQPLHDGEAAPDPAALMRSRFAAYARNKVDYILATTHPDGPHFQHDERAWKEDVRAFCRATRFEGLEILEAGEDFVHFRAALAQGGRDASFTERSTFAMHDGRWKYLDGSPTEA